MERGDHSIDVKQARDAAEIAEPGRPSTAEEETVVIIRRFKLREVIECDRHGFRSVRPGADAPREPAEQPTQRRPIVGTPVAVLGLVTILAVLATSILNPEAVETATGLLTQIARIVAAMVVRP